MLDGDKSKKALEKALVFLTKKDRTEREIIEKLSKSGYSKDVIDDVLVKLADYGYVNDEDYAKRYLDSLIEKGKGKYAIRDAMSRKGLPSELVANTIEDGYSSEREQENALNLANKVLEEVFTGNEETSKIIAKINRRLMGRGFSYEIINNVMSKIRERVNNV